MKSNEPDVRSIRRIVAGTPSEGLTASVALHQPIASRPSVPYAYDSADSDDQSTSDLKALFEEQQKDLSKDLLHLVAGSRKKSKALVKSKLSVQREPIPAPSINNSAKQEDSISARQRSVTSKPSKQSIKDSEK